MSSSVGAFLKGSLFTFILRFITSVYKDKIYSSVDDTQVHISQSVVLRSSVSSMCEPLEYSPAMLCLFENIGVATSKLLISRPFLVFSGQIQQTTDCVFLTFPEIGFDKETICMKCQSLFLVKNKKENISTNCRLLNFSPACYALKPLSHQPCDFFFFFFFFFFFVRFRRPRLP